MSHKTEEKLKKEKLKWEAVKLEAEAIGVIIRNVMMVFIIIGFIYQGGDLALKNVKFGTEGISIDFFHPKPRSTRGPSPAPTAESVATTSGSITSVSAGSGYGSGGGRVLRVLPTAVVTAPPPPPVETSADAPRSGWDSVNGIVLALMVLAAAVWVGFGGLRKKVVQTIVKQEEKKE